MLTASKLRADIYRVLDDIIETGIPVEIERRGYTLRISLAGEPAARNLEALAEHPGALSGDLEDIVHLDWSGEWRP